MTMISSESEKSDTLVRLSGIVKRFVGTLALDNIALEIRQGEFLAVLGPSGCGKTTLLRVLGGFIKPDQGSIEIDERDVTREGPETRPTNLVFQSYGLFPHMSVASNVGYGMRIAGAPRAEIAKQVSEVLALVRLAGFEQRMPRELSGGQQQRVALARALIMRPKLLLLDESLGALDLKLRSEMQEELRRIHQHTGGTFVIVTHDQGEAFSLADRVALMSEGRIVQLGTPQELYDHPVNLFAATFVGAANILDGELRDQAVQCALGTFGGFPAGTERVRIAFRPEAVRIAAGEEGIPTRVIKSRFQGSQIELAVSAESGESMTVILPREADVPEVGNSVSVEIDRGALHVFTSVGKKISPW